MGTGGSGVVKARRNQEQKLGMGRVIDALLSVVTIEAYKSVHGITKNRWLAGATGFLYENSADELFLVTNKHVVRQRKEGYYPDFLVVNFRCKHGVLSKTKTVKVKLYADKKPVWRVPYGKADIAAIPLAHEDLPEQGDNFPLQKTYALPRGCYPTVGSQALVLGFPHGWFCDPWSNFPIARMATIATPTWLTFEKRDCFLIDANLQHGMSGSPVISTPMSTYERDNKPVYGDARCYLIGIFSDERLAGDELLGLHTVWPSDLIENATTEGD